MLIKCQIGEIKFIHKNEEYIKKENVKKVYIILKMLSLLKILTLNGN